MTGVLTSKTLVPMLVLAIQAQGPFLAESPAPDIRIKMGAGAPAYCSGPRPGNLYMEPAEDPDDITLQLRLRLRYDNHGSETIVLPEISGWTTRMGVEGQEEITVLRDARVPGLVDVESVLAMSAPDETNTFRILPPGGDAGGVLTILQTDSYSTLLTGVTIPVVNRSSGIDLRGTMIAITMTRDHRSLPPNIVETLNDRWVEYGTVWTGIVQSEPMSFWIPPEPLTTPCMTP